VILLSELVRSSQRLRPDRIRSVRSAAQSKPVRPARSEALACLRSQLDGRVSLDETQMQIEDKLVNLAPGMAVTVEIKTGRRRIIEFLMSPLLRYRDESLRER